MRGYLQRLAASVSRPEPRLRPLMGSIFAGELREENVEEVQFPIPRRIGVEKVEGQITESVTPDPAGRLTRTAPMREAGASRVDKSPHVPLPFAQQVENAPESDTQEPPRFAPLVPRQPAQAESPVLQSQEKSPERLAKPHPRPATTTGKKELEEQAVPRETRVSFQPLVLRPIVFEEARMETPQASLQPVTAREPMRRRAIYMAHRETPERLATAKESERTANEEIQIHIGRIEVIASAPPAARVARAPTNRSTSLEDYLKRRNGRAG
jgi:hypothetical protein